MIISKSKQYRRKYIKSLKEKYGFGFRAMHQLGIELAKALYSRDNKMCQICKSKENIQIDHIDGKGRTYERKGLPMNNDLNNLRLLCASCHGTISGRLAIVKRKEKGMHNKKYYQELAKKR